jgi:hypothetical protein
MTANAISVVFPNASFFAENLRKNAFFLSYLHSGKHFVVSLEIVHPADEVRVSVFEMPSRLNVAVLLRKEISISQQDCLPLLKVQIPAMLTVLLLKRQLSEALFQINSESLTQKIILFCL